jgi:YggT family protein
MIYLANAATILIELIFGAASLLFMIRLLLQLAHANFNNPICQFFWRVTNPVLMPLRRWLPPVRGLDLNTAWIALLLQVAKLWLLAAVHNQPMTVTASLVLGVASLLSLLLTLYFWLLLIRILVSLLNPDARHPALPLLGQLTEPVLRPVRRRLPDMGGFDLSPLVVFVVILLARVLLVAPIQDFGTLLARGGL